MGQGAYNMTRLPPSPFITEPEPAKVTKPSNANNRFVLDEEAFMAELEPMPIFLNAPRSEGSVAP
jgi:hypothetical protein